MVRVGSVAEIGMVNTFNGSKYKYSKYNKKKVDLYS